MRKTNRKTKRVSFDSYVKKKVARNARVKKELKKADRAWDIALQIRALREKRGLTQAKLARLAGISQPNVARIEDADYQSYTLATLEKVTKALDAYIDVVVVPEESRDSHFPRPVFSFPFA